MGTEELIYSSLASDPDFLDLIHDFVSEMPEKCRKIEEFVANGDVVQLQRIVHQLRGSCGGYGFPTLTEAAGAIEESLKAKHTIESLKPRLDAFLNLLKRATASPQ